MTELVAMVLIALLAFSGYAAGRLHGQIGYRLGYRFGYRQGYFDGDRSSWNRRRREMQAALAAVLSTPAAQRPEAYPTWRPAGTTYASRAGDEDDTGEHSTGKNGTGSGPGSGHCAGSGSGSVSGAGGQKVGRHARADWVLVEVTG